MPIYNPPNSIDPSTLGSAAYLDIGVDPGNVLAVSQLTADYLTALVAEMLTTSTPLLQPVGMVIHLPYPVELSGGLWRDAQGWYWYAPTGNTIGAPASGADVASAFVEHLFQVLWTHIQAGTDDWELLDAAGNNVEAGASAQEDWLANRQLFVPDMRSRGILAAGAGDGMSDRLVGTLGGAETHSLTEAELATHSHVASAGNSGNHSHSTNFEGHLPGNGYSHVSSSGAWFFGTMGGISTNAAGNHSHSVTVNATGAGVAHTIMNPWKAYTELWFTGAR